MDQLFREVFDEFFGKSFVITVIQPSVPEKGRDKVSETVYGELQDIINKINKRDEATIAGDLNARVDNEPAENVTVDWEKGL